MTTITTLTTEATIEDIAIAAFHQDLASDFNKIQDENAYRLTHPTNEEKSIVIGLECDDEQPGWTWTQYELNEYKEWEDVTTGGDAISGDETMIDLLKKIDTTLTAWASES